MSNLTPEQESAIASFKGNIHLPQGGFHVLIIELCKEFQLPFQKVRSVLKDSQISIESKIRNEFDNVDESDLTKDNWLHLIKGTLAHLAKDNKLIMESLTNSELYIKVIDAIKEPVNSEAERQLILTDLALAYEHEVYKQLKAMLHTTNLYWELTSDLFKMTDEHREKFNDYPQHMEATVHLLELKEQIEVV